MKILQIGPIPPEIGGRSHGGVATHLWELANHLSQRGHQVAILADNYWTENREPKYKKDVIIFGNVTSIRNLDLKNIPDPSWWNILYRTKHHFGGLSSWQKTAIEISKYLKTIAYFKPDVIHVHHLERRFPLAFYPSDGKYPLVTTVHSTSSIEFGHPSHQELQKKFIKRNLAHAHNLIFVSNYIKKRFEILFPGFIEKINTWVVHNPVDSTALPMLPKKDARDRIGAKHKTHLLLYVGSLIPRKGARSLIESALRLKQTRNDIQVIIIGEGSQKSELERLVLDYKLETTISILGSKQQQDLIYYYNAADLFVLPSISESFGLVFFEAMLCGCPVVGSPEVLIELLPSNEYGYYVPPGDSDSLARTIEIALKKTWDRERIRNYALKFDWKNYIMKFEDTYMKVIQNETRLLEIQLSKL